MSVTETRIGRIHDRPEITILLYLVFCSTIENERHVSDLYEVVNRTAVAQWTRKESA